MKPRHQWLDELVRLHDDGVSGGALLNHLVAWASELADQGKTLPDACTEVEEACAGEHTAAAEAWEKVIGSPALRGKWQRWCVTGRLKP